MYWKDPELISNQTSFIFVKFRSKGLTPNLWTIISLEHAILSSWNTSSSQSPKSIIASRQSSKQGPVIGRDYVWDQLLHVPSIDLRSVRMTLFHNHKCLQHCWISLLLLFHQNSVLNLLSLWVWCSALATVCLWWHCQLQNK